jgi:hypothetical protein
MNLQKSLNDFNAHDDPIPGKRYFEQKSAIYLLSRFFGQQNNKHLSALT